jgi:hypothetical protein
MTSESRGVGLLRQRGSQGDIIWQAWDATGAGVGRPAQDLPLFASGGAQPSPAGALGASRGGSQYPGHLVRRPLPPVRGADAAGGEFRTYPTQAQTAITQFRDDRAHCRQIGRSTVLAPSGDGLVLSPSS